MFGISKLIGGVLNGAGVGSLAPFVNLTMQAIAGSQTGVLQALTKDMSILSKLSGVFGGGGGMLGNIVAGLNVREIQSSADRLAYVAVLQRALDKASKQQHFNLETAINDLWVSASNLRNGTASLQSSQANLSMGGAPAGAATAQMMQIKGILEKLKAIDLP